MLNEERSFCHMVLLKISWDCDNFHTLSSVITIEGSNYFFSFLENYYSLLHFLPFAVPVLCRTTLSSQIHKIADLQYGTAVFLFLIRQWYDP